MRNILIIGQCGVGKTWVMTELIEHFGCERSQKFGMIKMKRNDRVAVVGNYDGSMFQGSDKLSMAVMRNVPVFADTLGQIVKYCVWEGDRFTNSKFMNLVKPYVIRIDGDGSIGRDKRGSAQTERHLKAIATRVANIPYDVKVANSNEALEVIKNMIGDDK